MQLSFMFCMAHTQANFQKILGKFSHHRAFKGSQLNCQCTKIPSKLVLRSLRHLLCFCSGTPFHVNIILECVLRDAAVARIMTCLSEKFHNCPKVVEREGATAFPPAHIYTYDHHNLSRNLFKCNCTAQGRY